VATLDYEVESIGDAELINDQRFSQCWKVRVSGRTNSPPIVEITGTVNRCPGVGDVQTTTRMTIDQVTQVVEQQLARYQAPGTDGLREHK
jgi:hypothetical protein